MTMAAKALLGKKIGMTQMFSPDGLVTPVTAIEAGPCPVIQHRTPERDGYVAVQIGFDPKRKPSVKKPEKGHFEKAGVEPRRFVREIRLAAAAELETYPVGSELTAEIFAEGEYVDVVGTSKGRGHTGVMKRHNFGGAAMTSHGTHEKFRHGGSIGAGAYPGRVFKGTKMSGQHGNMRRTARNLQVMRVDAEHHVLYIKGAIPGPINGYVYVRPAKTKQAKAAGK
jgi:large subunit ribosomal protein L3